MLRDRLSGLSGIPRVAWACVALAMANAFVWAVIIPPLQIIDEQSHGTYVEYIAKSGKLPGTSKPANPDATEPLSSSYRILIGGIPFSVEGPPSWSPQRDRDVRRRLARTPNTLGTGLTLATNNPPLYYALAAPVSRATQGASLTDQLLYLRWFSAIFAGLTTLFVYLFLRELLPATPWAWLVGTLAAVFHPLFGFQSGGITVDGPLLALAAALLFLVARAFRRGLSPGLGAAMGLVAVGGCLTKGAMYGLLPGAALAVLICAVRERRTAPRRAILTIAAGLACFVIPFVIWIWANVAIFDRAGSTTSNGLSRSAQGTWGGQLSYIWQFYLPRLPWMEDTFTTYPKYGLWQIDIKGWVGRFGWHQYGFPLWANVLGLIAFLVIGGMAAAALYRARDTLRSRLGELAVYVVMLVSLLLLITTVGYRTTAFSRHNFEQGRYLLPLLPLYGALIAVAARAWGRRYGPVVGALLVVLALGHTLAAQLLTLVRYYA